MFGVSPIEMIVEIALSLLAVMCNFHNHFCPAELLHIIEKYLSATVHRYNDFTLYCPCFIKVQENAVPLLYIQVAKRFVNILDFKKCFMRFLPNYA